MTSKNKNYNASDYGKDEVKLLEKFYLQRDDSKKYFLEYLKPRYDQSYKLYVAYNGDRAKEIQKWQSNIFVPYILGVIETVKPRILDSRPDFSVMGRNEDDQDKANKVQKVLDYTWEKAGMDEQTEDLVSASMIYGMSWLQTFWKKDMRTEKYLVGRDVTTKKKKYVEKTVIDYDAPAAMAVDNYDFRYDWRNIDHASKQFFFQRFVKNGAEIRRMFPEADPVRLAQAFEAVGKGDLLDYGAVRMQAKQANRLAVKGSDGRAQSVDANYSGNYNYYGSSGLGDMMNRYQSSTDPDLKFHECYLWWRPFEDKYTVMVNDVPILDGAEEPNPYNFKKAPYIDIPFLRLPFEYEGLGYPLLLEQPQLMLNLIKNQRLDATTMSIHKMWIVNPLANIKKDQLVTRPFGIIWSPDPNGVREVQFSDVKESAYREEELLKADLRYASGVDDISMGQSGGADSATESRHLREATLERVRLFLNHLGAGYSHLLRMWLSMYRQFLTSSTTIRITGDDGNTSFQLIEKDDVMGEYDLAASVLPSIAGKSDVDKKQNMDLFQLLVNLPITDISKLTSKVLHPWGWTLSSIAKEAQPGQPSPDGSQPGAPADGSQPEQPEGTAPQPGPADQIMHGSQQAPGGAIPQGVIDQALGATQTAPPSNPFAGAGLPSNIAGGNIAGGAPPVPGGGAANRTGRVNTNVPSTRGASDTGAALANRAQNIQR